MERLVMKNHESISYDFVVACLDYDPESGLFGWKSRPCDHFKNLRSCNAWNARFAGSAAGNIGSNGYIRIKLLGFDYRAHRLAWFISYKQWPIDIDHINGVVTDNRIINLRIATSLESGFNRFSRKKSDNFIGISWNKANSNWTAQIAAGESKKQHIGSFAELKDAVLAYNAECERLHGEYGKRKIEHNLNRLRELGL
ncbi:HNH endonuclease [Raoultella ornithinolytica]|nr:HNH endonuclease [Raoultella ornithinolytica]